MVDAKMGWVLFGIEDAPFAWRDSPNDTFNQYTHYKPLMLDNPLWVNIRGLRAAREQGACIEFDEQGYRLSVPDRFLFTT